MRKNPPLREEQQLETAANTPSAKEQKEESARRGAHIRLASSNILREMTKKRVYSMSKKH